MSRASIPDLQTAAAWLEEYGGRLGDRDDETACLRVAEWLRYVVEQREEASARLSTDRTHAPAPLPLRLSAMHAQRDGDAEQRRLAKLKSAFETVWRARSA